jgi:hypothetical protein
LRVPDLEALIAAEEQQALPETRLVNALHSWNRPTIDDAQLLDLCRDAWGRPAERKVDFRGVPYATRGAPTDEGWRVNHSLVSILAGLYPGRCYWRISTVISALHAYLESQYAGS